ncbi:MAG: hypothetical protein J6J03_02220, partial [Tyzzerella sp.]|nr:hypothetical protein [Tyzzerella sp.]
TTLNNVKITDTVTSDIYGIWISPNGQTISINDLEMDMTGATDGRGIKIDEQYVSSPAKVTLNINGATFKTEEKAAILVKSVAGADITLNNIDITDVVDDSENEVWVDEASAAYYDFVTVDGGTKILEGGDKMLLKDEIYYIASKEAMFDFAKKVNGDGSTSGESLSGKTVKLLCDIDLYKEPWTPIGQTGKTEFRGIFDGQGHTIKNLSIDMTAYTDQHTSSGLFGWAERGVTIQNVKIDGATVKGNHNVAAIVGYTYSGKISGCTVSNAEITCTHANGDACGDKAGVIVGYAGGESRISDCTATSCKVTAGRDAGQLIGAGYHVSVSNCRATDVVVSAHEDNSDCTGANINNAVIGRVL